MWRGHVGFVTSAGKAVRNTLSRPTVKSFHWKRSLTVLIAIGHYDAKALVGDRQCSGATVAAGTIATPARLGDTVSLIRVSARSVLRTGFR